HTAAQIAVEAIQNKTGASYKYGNPASGTSIDYMLSRKIPYTYGIELRPEDNETDIGFDIPATSIQPAGEEMLSAFLTMAEYISTTKNHAVFPTLLSVHILKP
uniref:Peptidase_M14 domain-containing protein n=1 Tax=Syphacia muris TaxID=451379 RepID=A0A0N5ACY7_9BILA